MSQNVDRMWNIRDAILAWLYEQAAALKSPDKIDAAEIQHAVHWQAADMTDEELRRDAQFLLDEQLIQGVPTFGGGVVRPRITSEGEKFAAKGISVRPGPEKQANITGVTNNYTFNNSGPTQIAVNSQDFEQNMTVEAKAERANAIADALDRLAEEEAAANGEQVRELAGEVRRTAAEPGENNTGLKAALLNVISAVSSFANSQAGQQIVQMAVNLLPALG